MRLHIHGVHVPNRKNTAELAALRLPIPETVEIPMSMHIGAPAIPVVKPGDSVRVGQLIGKAGGFVSAPVYASVSGTVKKIGQQVGSGGRLMQTVVIAADGVTGEPLYYSGPSNKSPAREEYERRITERVERIEAAHPEKQGQPIPADLVTCSGSGLDPHISPDAAEYQVARVANARGMSEDEVRAVIEKYTEGRFLGIFGEPTVNVLKVNLALDGILK